MNIPQPLIESYAQLLPVIEEVEKRVNQTLLRYSQDRLLPFISRIKTIESAAEKIETGRYRSFPEIDDLVAFTLVVPTLAQVADAADYCGNVFNLTSIRERASAKKSPDLFRFDATRLYGSLIKPEGLETVDASIFDVKFEIQLRTAFEHAWIVSTHPLTYKTDNIDWKRFRLAAQLKAASEQLDLAVIQFESLASGISEAPWPELTQKRRIVGLVDGLVQDGIMPIEAGPKDMSRFAENLVALIRASKRKLEVERALDELETGFQEFNVETFPRSASLLQVCIGILCKRGLLSGPLQKYSCHITEHLAQLFPEVSALSPIFEYTVTKERA
jgi:ppGpp synthetase/RelA/SpoT-type nucleotidyltranferase